MDDKPSFLARIAAILLLPVALIVLVPVMVLLAAGLYLFAIIHAVSFLVARALGRPIAAEAPLQKPHFLDSSTSVPVIPKDQSGAP